MGRLVQIGSSQTQCIDYQSRICKKIVFFPTGVTDHSHKKRKDSLETWTDAAGFFYNLSSENY